MQMKPQTSREGMRRLCALFLLLLSVGPWLVAISSSDAISEASLPACCRTHGKHKCLMRFTRDEGAVSSSGGATASQVSERCPYNPTFTTTAHSDPFGQPEKNIFRVGLGSTSSLMAMATRPCMSFPSRANCKRGPPSPVLSLKATTTGLQPGKGCQFTGEHDASTKTDFSFSCSDAAPDLDHTA
jgi:hypothetical protein